MVSRLPVFVLLVSILASIGGAETVDFSQDVRPILSDNCLSCHGPDAATREAGLRLDLPEGAFAELGGGAAIVPGDSDASEAIARIEQEDSGLRMPPAETGKRLSAEEISVLRRWIDSGATYDKHWAFEAPKRPEIPAVMQVDWPTNPLDHFVLATLEQRGSEPSPPAEKSRWLRRVSLDLTGLPPTPEELHAFLRDEAPGAERRVVDRLLHSERYGEAMALHWLDAARYADTDGYQNDGPREMWPWRDWVIDAYNAGTPFDQFTIEQLAGDLLPGATLEQKIATGFNRNHRYNSEAGLVLEEFLFENAVDRVDTTSTVWMGLTMGCARCHDHKFDPVSQREYYQLISFFDNAAESGRAVKFGNSEPWVTAPTRAQQAELDRRERAIESQRNALNQTVPRVDQALRGWLNDGTIDLNDSPAVSQQLRHHFTFEQPDGDEPSRGDEESHNRDRREPTTVPGVIGNAWHFDGTQTAKLGEVADARGEIPFSLSFWIRPEMRKEGVVLSRQTNNTRRSGLLVDLVDGRLRFFIITRWVAGVGAVESKRTLPTDRWTHVTLTNDGSQSAMGMRIYLDGESVPTRTLYNTNSNTGGTKPNTELTVGGGVRGENYRGAIDQLRYYDRTLWEGEIRRLADEPGLPQRAATDEDQRDDVEQQRLRQWFLEHAAPEPLQKLARRLHQTRLRRDRFWDSLPTTMVMKERPQKSPTRVRKRGIYDQLGETVEPDVPEIFPPLRKEDPQDRLAFAKWLVSGDHPLTARVTVNRHWQRFFGSGLVATPEDFGLQGNAPSHPELLDWLATEFVRSGWNVRHLQRLIVLSSTYRQSSQASPEKLAADPDNRWLARGPRQRLPAHVVRDQALSVAGLLTHRQGGPAVKTFQPEGLWEEMSNMKYERSEGEDLYRRSLYTFWKRTVAPPSMSTLDAADRETCAVLARRTNTPLQALTLLNETAFVHAAFGLAHRLWEAAGPEASLDHASVTRHGFRIVTARDPTEKEAAALQDALTSYQSFYRDNSDAARQLIASADTPLPLEACREPETLAALTAFANVLLNLDEVITKE